MELSQIQIESMSDSVETSKKRPGSRGLTRDSAKNLSSEIKEISVPAPIVAQQAVSGGPTPIAVEEIESKRRRGAKARERAAATLRNLHRVFT